VASYKASVWPLAASWEQKQNMGGYTCVLAWYRENDATQKTVTVSDQASPSGWPICMRVKSSEKAVERVFEELIYDP
jgi:hypothetical protein